jgi:hypothetical protein
VGGGVSERRRSRASTWSGRLGRRDTPGHNQPGLVGDDDGLGPVAYAEPGKGPADVGLHGLLEDDEPLSYLGVRQSVGDVASTSVSPGVRLLGLGIGAIVRQRRRRYSSSSSSPRA